MDEGVLEEGRIGAELGGVADQVAIGDLGGFLHDVAELAGELEAAHEAVGPGGLDGERGAAHGGPGETRDDAGARELAFVAKHRAAEIVLQIGLADADRRLLAFEHPHGDLAHDLSELFLQPTHPGIAGIALDQGAQCLGVERHCAFG